MWVGMLADACAVTPKNTALHNSFYYLLSFYLKSWWQTSTGSSNQANRLSEAQANYKNQETNKDQNQNIQTRTPKAQQRRTRDSYNASWVLWASFKEYIISPPMSRTCVVAIARMCGMQSFPPGKCALSAWAAGEQTKCGAERVHDIKGPVAAKLRSLALITTWIREINLTQRVHA